MKEQQLGPLDPDQIKWIQGIFFGKHDLLITESEARQLWSLGRRPLRELLPAVEKIITRIKNENSV